MKQLLFAIATMATVGVSAQSDKYTAAMEKNLAQFDSVKTTAGNQALSSAFERIGDAEKTKWLPYYYAALALTTPGWLDPKLDKDANSTKINSMCDKAEALAESNEENHRLYNPHVQNTQTLGLRLPLALQAGWRRRFVTNRNHLPI